MCIRDRQKQTVLEEKSSIVNENTSGMAVDGHIGTWHTIDHKEIDGHTFWLMEHDTFGDDASCIIVDERGELVPVSYTHLDVYKRQYPHRPT